MSQPDSFTQRRRFLQAISAATVAAALPAAAEDIPALSIDDPTARALGYVEDGANVDAARFPAHRPGQDCLGCNFYQGKAARGPCSLFPGKSVAGKGWCSAFVARS